MESELLKLKVKKLREKGKTFSEIKENVGVNISKSTISYWCKGIVLSKKKISHIKNICEGNIKKAQKLAVLANQQKHENKLNRIIEDNKDLSLLLKNLDVAKIVLAVLYICEGSKNKRSSCLTIGNSDPKIIKLFLQLLRKCYRINESKFRCTVQCRADQDTKKLEIFWSKVTGIPLSLFYKARIDNRTIGKKSEKTDYHGVCRINYFSADIFWELMIIGDIICQ